MCTDENNDKNKTNLPPPLFHSFLNFWKPTKSRTLKLSDFQFIFTVFTVTFCEKFSVITWVGYFVLQIQRK